MSSIKKPNPERLSEDSPEWTREDIAKARAAEEVLEKHIGATATIELLRRGGGVPHKPHPLIAGERT